LLKKHKVSIAPKYLSKTLTQLISLEHDILDSRRVNDKRKWLALPYRERTGLATSVAERIRLDEIGNLDASDLERMEEASATQSVIE